MDPLARSEQRTTRHGLKPRTAMTKRLRGSAGESEADCEGNRSRGGPRCDGWARGMGTSGYNQKIFRPKISRDGARTGVGTGREGRRSTETRIARQLETIHPNPGPRGRGRRSVERNKAYQRRKRYRRRRNRRAVRQIARGEEERAREQRRHEEANKRQPKVVTWNVQKMAMRQNNRRRLRELGAYCVKKKWDVVMLTEITSQDEGFFWIGDDDDKVVVIHGKKAAVMLTGSWATDWTDQGSQRWLGNRVAAVKVNHIRLVSGYQPLWNYGEVEMKNYRTELEHQVQKTRANEWLIIGGDHNAVVGKRIEGLDDRDDAVGRYGLGQRNDAGRDLLRWCGEQGLAWVNSFYPHNWRGTWCHPARNTWNEIDGFIIKNCKWDS